MAYLAFYRMFRPDTLDKVVRQEHIVKILKNQIESGKIGHAYLFCGPRGTGKTSVAKIFARAINCEHPVNGSPCGKCPACLALSSGGNLDISEIDAASNNGVDEMRDLREKVQYPPVAGRYKVYIIDEVHMLTASAFNAVLKTLEEPPAHAVFILATTEPQKIPATILSRCMRFDFKLIPQRDLEGLLKGILQKIGKEYEEEAVAAIARAGAGSARDTLSIADMCVSYSSGKLTYSDVNAVLGSADFYKIAEVVRMLLCDNSGGALSSAEEVFSGGKSAGVFIKDILSFLNNVAVAKMCKNAKQILNLPDEMFSAISDIAQADGHKILRATEIFVKAEGDMRYAADARVVLETAILRCTLPQADYNIDSLIARVSALEKKLENGVAASVSQTAYAKPAESAPSVASKEGSSFAKPFAGSAPTAKLTAQTDEMQSDMFSGRTGKATAFWADTAPQKKPSVVAKPALKESAEEDVFASSAPSASVSRPASVQGGAQSGSLTGKSVHAALLRALRTTHKNAVLFTLCSDLTCVQEGGKFVFNTENETVNRAITRPDNAKILSEVLAGAGVTDYEVRLVKKDDGYKKAIDALKANFGGTDIDIK